MRPRTEPPPKPPKPTVDNPVMGRYDEVLRRGGRNRMNRVPADSVSGVGESEQSTPEEHTGPPDGHWLSVDPGQVHVGVGVWEGEDLVNALEVSPENLKATLRQVKPELVVIEAFSLRSPRWTNAQATQAVDTIKLIGAVEAILEEWDGKVVEQQPSVRHVAQSSPYWRELPADVPANSHARSAVAHGLYYLNFAKR